MCRVGVRWWFEKGDAKVKNEDIKVGDKLIAVAGCGFPDGTTKGKTYTVTQVHPSHSQLIFKIINDDGREVLPISTTFKKEATECSKR